jgi:hypothetical protein
MIMTLLHLVICLTEEENLGFCGRRKLLISIVFACGTVQGVEIWVFQDWKFLLEMPLGRIIF